jgi:hypothetical protein
VAGIRTASTISIEDYLVVDWPWIDEHSPKLQKHILR